MNVTSTIRISYTVKLSSGEIFEVFMIFCVSFLQIIYNPLPIICIIYGFANLLVHVPAQLHSLQLVEAYCCESFTICGHFAL